MSEQAPDEFPAAPAGLLAEAETHQHNAILEGINGVLKAVLACQTEQELGVACLEIAQKLTQSSFGFIGEVDEKGLQDIALSNPGWDACGIIDSAHRNPPGNFAIHGIYGRVISEGKPLFTNDPASHPHRIGLPAGHPPLKSFLAVPLFRESQVAGIIALANRPGGYFWQQQETLEALAPVIAEAFQRKRAEQALRSSEARLHLACLAANAGAWEWDLRSNELLWSEEMWQVYGLPPGSCEPLEAWLRTVHPDDRDLVDQAVQDAIHHGRELAVEWRMSGAGGAERWLMSHGRPQYADDGGLSGYVGIVIDITGRKLAEQELRASEEKFSAMFRAAPIAIALSTLPEGALHDVNPAWLELTGFACKDEVLGKTSLELGLIGDSESRARILDEYRQNGCVRNAEQPALARSGARLSLLINLDRVEIGGRSFILSVMEDITARKQAEQELLRHRDHLDSIIKERTTELESRNDQLLREATERLKVEAELLQSEQRYRGIVQYQTVYIDRYLPGGILTFVNDALARITGLEPEQLLGHSFFPFLHDEDRPMVIRTIESLSEEHPIAVLESRVQLPDGLHWQQWEHRAVLDAEGNIVEYQSVGRDITERKQAEQALQESEQRYRAVVEDQTELICRSRPDGSIAFANEAYCRFFGKTHAEVLAEDWHPYVFAEDLPMVLERMSLMTPDHPAVVIENRLVSGQGEVHWMQFANRGFFDAQGRLVEIQAVGHDITRLKEVEQTLKRYAQRLIVLEEELRKKVAMELHDDIGQELTALDFNLTHIRKKLSFESDANVSGLLEDSRQLTKEINRTVRNLMLDLRPSQLDIYGLAGAIESYARQYARRTGLEVAVHQSPEFAGLSPEQEISLFRITQEALTNIAKYAGATRVSVSLARDGARVRLSIADDGQGFQVQRAALHPLESGWGLTIMRERAEMVGGSFRLDSHPGEGTTIVVELDA